MTLSERHLGLTLLLLLLAAFPILYGAVVYTPRDGCAQPEALFEAEAIAGATELHELTREERKRDTVLQWTVGERQDPGSLRGPVRFRILRTTDPSWLYLNPTRFAPRFPDLVGFEPKLLKLDHPGGPLPVRVVRPLSADRNIWIVAYFFVQGGRPIAHPFWAQLVSALPGVGPGPGPLTLYLTSVTSPATAAEGGERAALDWLRAAWDRHRAVCGG